VAAEHRLGTLEVGDAAVIVVAAAAHRDAAFDACRYVIEEMKRRVPIWKREHYVDGTAGWVDPTVPDGVSF
jgi:molybdopterin synthase catalytic subunit